MSFNTPITIPEKLLKFCYFLITFFLLSCGNEQRAKIDNTEQVTEESKVIENTTNSTTKIILCFGDSITAGYGLDDTNDAYPALIQKKIDSLNLDYTVVNSGLSGETSAGGKSRIDWILNQDIDIFLLELGGNDGLRGLPLTATRANLQAIIDSVKTKRPDTTIILAGMELPPNMGQDYTSEFRNIFAELAKENNTEFIPFILKDVGGQPELNQSDGIHPTEEGHVIVANTVWERLNPLLNK
ncbi:arylesterase precursor [Winogradskyella sp. PG-2]|nr:arylesterase precursor [Winogradskyella sp. PG-2]